MNDRQITVPLVTRTGLHIGVGYGDAVTDAFVRQDAQGRPVIPGTSLAGALRTLATRLAPRLNLKSGHPVCKALAGNDGKPCGCIVCKLFGDVNPGDEANRRRDKGAEKATAARLWVFDAYPVGDPASWIRDGVGIERAARVAYRQGQIKFDLEVLPPNTEFELRLELQASDGTTDVDAEEQLLAAVLAEWAAGRGAIGGRTSRGLGALQVKENAPIVYRRFDLSDKDELFAYLSEDDPWPKKVEVTGWLARRVSEIDTAALTTEAPNGAACCWVRLTAEIQAIGPFLVNSPVTSAESSFDHAPLLAGGDRDKPLLPGSGLKGALRSQAERIARTLTTWDVYEKTAETEQEAAFRQRCPACSPVVGEDEEPLASCDALLKGKHLPSGPVVKTVDEVNDEHLCLACRLFGSTRRGSRLRVEDALFVGRPRYKPRDLLAIDRFTGGGADQFKFDAAVLWQPKFQVRLFLENPEPWELGWLLLALRDVHEGLVPLGFGAAKGFGQVRAEKWQVEIGYLTTEDARRLGIPADGKRVQDSLYHVLIITNDDLAEWRSVGKRWVEAFVTEAAGFTRDPSDSPEALPALTADTYFGTEAEELYPVKEVLDD